MARQKKSSQINRTSKGLTRRTLLQQAGKLTLLSSVVTGGAFLLHGVKPVREKKITHKTLKDFRQPLDKNHATMAIVRGQNIPQMVKAATDGLGGLNRFIKKGERVLLKPNVGWDRQPEQAANTNPEVVGAVVKACLHAGASKVWVTDVSLNDPRRAFRRSGIFKAASKAGAEVLIPTAHDFIATDMGGEVLGVWPVAQIFHQVERVINLPIVKHHSLCGCTLAMKNWYGVISGTRNQLHQTIHTSIVDLAAAVRPTLTIMDAIRVLKQNGPTGGSLADVREENTLIAGLDEVALDAFAMQFLNLQPHQVPYMAMAEKRGLGTTQWQTLTPKEIQLGVPS
ncbi:DUF362 domain-containing protein [Magnetococcales bacterium HHB-1]